MDTTRFLEYLHENEATASLAQSLTELVTVRRLAAARRASLTAAPDRHAMSVAC
jgi:hypothetical protein